MRTVSSLVLLALSASVVAAQPAPPPQDPQAYPPPPQQYPQQYPPPQQGYPPPQQGYPPPQQGYPPPQQGYPQQGYGYQQPMQVQLTMDEKWLLERGYISDGAHIGGGLASLFLGFGLGQAIQGRWSETGWIFTLGEGVSTFAILYGFGQAFSCAFGGNDEINSDCDSNNGVGIMWVGMIGYTVFRVWGTIDAFVAPPAHNSKVRALRMRLGMPVPMYSRITPFVKPSRDTDGGVAGISMSF